MASITGLEFASSMVRENCADWLRVGRPSSMARTLIV